MGKTIVIDIRIRRSSTGRYADRLVEHLQKIDKENNYIILLEPTDTWQPSAPNFKAVACKYKRFSFNPADQITFAKFLNSLQADLVHFAMTPMEPVFYSKPRITTTHDLTMLRFTRAGKLPTLLHWIRMAGYKFLFWHSHRASRKIIVPTNFVGQDLIKLQPFTKKKIVVTYESSEPPTEIEATPPEAISALGPQPSALAFLLHVGSPLPHKNIECLIKAFTLLKEKHPNLLLVLAGKKEQYFEKLENSLKNSSVKDDIILPGFVSDGQLKWLYENAAAYVLPSLSEGFGLPGLEAMAHGTPLVSSNATCLPEVYGQAAQFFDPKDYLDMAAKIDEVITNPALADSLVKNGHKQLKNYSWSKMASETLGIYKSVLEGKK